MAAAGSQRSHTLPVLSSVSVDRLHQVERWATGAVEIFFSHRNPLWSHCGTALFLRQRIA